MVAGVSRRELSKSAREASKFPLSEIRMLQSARGFEVDATLKLDVVQERFARGAARALRSKWSWWGGRTACATNLLPRKTGLRRGFDR